MTPEQEDKFEAFYSKVGRNSQRRIAPHGGTNFRRITATA